jgi:hypothetical protein
MIEFPQPKKISERVNRLFFPDDSVKCGESYRQGGKKKKNRKKSPVLFTRNSLDTERPDGAPPG